MYLKKVNEKDKKVDEKDKKTLCIVNFILVIRMSKHKLLARESVNEFQEELIVTEFSTLDDEGSLVSNTLLSDPIQEDINTFTGTLQATSNWLTEIQPTGSDFFIKSTKATLIGKHRIKLPGEAKRVSVRSTLLLPNNRLIVVDNNNENTKLFDQDFRCISVLKPKIYDICLSNINETEIYATGFAGSIYRVSTEPGLKILKTFELAGGCWGITSCLTNKIAVTVKQGDTYTLVILNAKGEIVHRIEAGDIEDLTFGDPLYLISIKEGQQILISDWSNNSVTCLDLEVGVMFVYQDERLKRPHSLATDGKDNLFIACRVSNNIHQVSTATGKKLDILLTRQDELISPGGIEYDAEHNTILIQSKEDDDNIEIYQLEGGNRKTNEEMEESDEYKLDKSKSKERTNSEAEHER